MPDIVLNIRDGVERRRLALPLTKSGIYRMAVAVNEAGQHASAVQVYLHRSRAGHPENILVGTHARKSVPLNGHSLYDRMSGPHSDDGAMVVDRVGMFLG